METLRCLIADIPQNILADIVRRVTQQDEKIDVIGQVRNIDGITGFLRRENIDVLIMGMRDGTPHQFCQDIFRNFPDLLIVGLVDDGRMAVACLADVSSRQLLDIITLLGGREGLPGG